MILDQSFAVNEPLALNLWQWALPFIWAISSIRHRGLPMDGQWDMVRREYETASDCPRFRYPFQSEHGGTYHLGDRRKSAEKLVFKIKPLLSARRRCPRPNSDRSQKLRCRRREVQGRDHGPRRPGCENCTPDGATLCASRSSFPSFRCDEAATGFRQYSLGRPGGPCVSQALGSPRWSPHDWRALSRLASFWPTFPTSRTPRTGVDWQEPPEWHGERRPGLASYRWRTGLYNGIIFLLPSCSPALFKLTH